MWDRRRPLRVGAIVPRSRQHHPRAVRASGLV